MAAQIKTKSSNFGMDIIKRSAELLKGATHDYISDAMPVTTSTIKGAKEGLSDVRQQFTTTAASILPKVRQLKHQYGIKDALNWFMESAEGFNGDSGVFDSSLDFDIPDDDFPAAEIAEVQIGEEERNANKVAGAIVESAHRSVEAHVDMTSTVVEKLDQQIAAITTGFDNTTTILNKILEVVTKNTSAAIEATVGMAGGRSEDPAGNMLQSGKFNLSEYKKIIAKNIQTKVPEASMISAFLPMLTSPDTLKMIVNPENLVGMAFNGLMNKKAPNLKKNLSALDEVVNNTIMSSLIRLGENTGFDNLGTLGKIFGIDSSRKEFNPSRSTLEVKTVPFDSIAHESITNAIPGYLQKILAAISGENVIYDYRSRAFRSQRSVNKDFLDVATSTGNLGRASSKVRNAFGEDQFGSMIYDLMVTDLGSKTHGSVARKTLEGFSLKPGAFEDYVKKTLFGGNGVQMTEAEEARIKQMGNNLVARGKDNIAMDMSNQIAMANVNRAKRMGAYINEAEAYNVDLSGMSTDILSEMKNILQHNGRLSASTATVKTPGRESLDGINYTNKALYEIFRVLNRGINVFRVGKDDKNTTRFKPRGKAYLHAPAYHKPSAENDMGNQESTPPIPYALSSVSESDEPNLLENQQLEDGTTEDLTRGQRFARWGKKRGGNLVHAIFSGSPEQVKESFGLILKDVTEVTGSKVKEGAKKINDQFGNVTGFLKHKIFGTGYKYIDTDGTEKEVKANDKGGYFGFVKDYVKDMFKGTKEKAKGWFKSVASYFDYGDSKDDKGVANKRKKFLASSVGAFAGAGLLGGPIGLIMGAVAGNALSGANIGDKIKELLIGRDEKTGKAKGIITRAVDGIVDPLKYQFGKTFHKLGGILKKNILGPISDIGFAIKERITNAAHHTFGKVFSFIGKIITAPFKAVAKIASAPFKLIGGAIRSAAGIGGGLLGSALGAAANIIAPDKETRDKIKDRKKARKASVKDEMKYEINPETGEVMLDENGKPIKNKYSSYKRYKKAENERRRAWKNKFSADGYTSEEIVEVQAEEAKKTAENTAEIAKNTEEQNTILEKTKEAAQELARHTDKSATNSIFTHDNGIHSRLDIIIDYLKGRSDNDSSDAESSDPKDHRAATVAGIHENDDAKNDRDEEFANSATVAAATIASNGEISNSDERLVGQIVSEAAKDNSNKATIRDKLTELIQGQEEKSEGEGEKKESFWDKILGILDGADGILPNLLKWGGIAAGVALLVNNLNAGDLLKNVLGNIGNAVEFLFGKKDNGAGGSGDAVDNGINAALSLADAKVANKHSLYLPGADIYHGEDAADGTSVVNQGASSAKDTLLLWNPAAKSIAGPALANVKSTSSFNKALKYDQKASAASAAGKKWASKYYQKKSNSAMDRAIKYEDQAKELKNNAGTDVFGNITKNAARVGVMSVASKGVGSLTSTALQRVTGMDKEKADNIGDVATSGTAAALMMNQGKSMMKGKTSIVDWLINLIKKGFDFLADHISAVDKLKGFGSKIKSFFNKAYQKTVGKMTAKIAEKVAAGIAKIVGKEVTADLVNAVTLGIPIALGAISGLASGLCGVEHLFMVLPKEADATMTIVSAILGTAFGALEMTPGVGLIVGGLELLDELIFKGIFGASLRQYIAWFLYNLIKGDAGATLSEKQAAFTGQRDLYNEKYGADMNSQTFNDMVNNGGWLDKLWRGGTKYDENGNLKFDDAGGRIDGGLKGLFVGGEKQYVMGEDGKVRKDSNGRAIVAIDAKGHILKKDKKWGDHVGNWFSDVGKWFGGGDIYETDENGMALVDENGNYIVKEHKGNVFQRTGAAISDWWGGKEITNPDGTVTKTEGFKDAVARTLGNIGSTIAKPFQDAGSAIATWWSGKTEVDENGNPILDENGKPIKKGGFKDWAVGGLGKIASSTGNFFRGIGAAATDLIAGEYERDENGNPLLDENGKPIRKGGLAGWIKTGVGKINESFVKPAKEMIAGATSWVKEKADWVKDGVSSAGKWISDKVSSAWTAISIPVKDFVGGAKDWIKDKAEWVKDGVADAGAWIADKASSAWTAISTPVKDFVSGATDWVKEKADWVGEKAKSAKDWIVSKVSNLYSSITGGIKDLADGATSWVKEKADWVKEGVSNAGDWLAEKASSAWSWFTNTLKSISGKGEQAKADEEYIKNHGTGGPVVKEDISATAISANSDGTSSSLNNNPPVAEGGNPLSKAFSITSKFGPRDYPHSGKHYGIDIVPKDGSGVADIGSRFNGVISKVVSDVPNSDTAKFNGRSWSYNGKNPAGNQVWIDTDSGMRIKNMHIAAGTIPSNIRKGARVQVGDKLGIMGTTGWSTGKHLHYQMERNTTDGNDAAFDPTSNISNGSTISSFISNGNGNLPAPDEENVQGGGSVLSKIIDALSTIGNGIFEFITGGILKGLTGSNEEPDNGPAAILNSKDFTNVELSGDHAALWEYFRNLGYTDNAIAGILGCWEAESSNRSRRVEWDYSDSFKETLGYDRVLDDREAMDKFAIALFNQYRKQGLGIDQGAYKAEDNHYYPGIGYAQWTGPRAKRLLDYARSHNMDWGASATQLAYLDTELSGKYSDVKTKLAAAKTPEEAGLIFSRDFEKHKGEYVSRQSAARSIYDQLHQVPAGSAKDDDYDFKPDINEMEIGIGGPEVSTSTLASTSNYVPATRKAVKTSSTRTYRPGVPVARSASSFRTSIPSATSLHDEKSGTTGADIDRLISVMGRMIDELRMIRDNTGSSSDLLSELNEKEFVDKPLRDSLAAMGKIKSKSSPNRPRSSQSTARSVASMARP